MDQNIVTKVYSMLDKNAKDKVYNSHKNILTIFQEDNNLKEIIRTNEFSKTREINKRPFWRRKDDTNILWTDEDDSQLFIYFGRYYEITVSKRIKEVVDQQFYENVYNPVKDYLNGLQWDGKERVERLFIDYLGANNSEYVQEVTKLSLVAGVKRIMEPGCKHDTVLVLVGGQGAGKSTMLSKLGMEWFNESLSSFKGDEAYIKISSSWIIELAELTALKTADSESIKSFISAKEDVYRPKYGRNPIRSPRKCVFFGTTNNFEFLKDQTGNRRWLPIEVNHTKRSKSPFEEFTQHEVDQVWAEAVYLYKNGAKTFLDKPELLEAARQLQEYHKEDNGLQGVIETFLNTPILENWYELSIPNRQLYYKYQSYKNPSAPLVARTKVCALEIWRECLIKNTEMSKSAAAEINQILRSLDYLREARTTFGQYGQQRGFIFK
ncbi:virulence-associated protein E [Bacillus sp. V3B]|uniref:virulence-associated E family protein n=1 Tax=Bacillus sp. V3B TaxID=2804915 RepID=UPI00210DC56C|nr:virulence-associated E family protein [Bacillus sp. V3B]MCQ6276411.1 virulence-associated protein E [Bacillus sp. V3B]